MDLLNKLKAQYQEEVEAIKRAVGGSSEAAAAAGSAQDKVQVQPIKYSTIHDAIHTFLFKLFY